MLRLIRLAGIALAAAVLVVGTALPALADRGDPRALDASLVGLPATLTNQSLFGITAGGLPWRIAHGSVELSARGHLEVDVRGLVLDAGANAGPNPIANGQAIVTCAGAPAAISSVVPFSPAGNAHVDERIALPATCLAPAVFFAGVPAPGVDRWFAVSGW